MHHPLNYLMVVLNCSLSVVVLVLVAVILVLLVVMLASAHSYLLDKLMTR